MVCDGARLVGIYEIGKGIYGIGSDAVRAAPEAHANAVGHASGPASLVYDFFDAPVSDEAEFAEVAGFDLIPDEVQFADNPEPRCPCVLVVDVSESMGEGDKILHLNAGIDIFEIALKEDPLASLRTEVAIVTIGNEAQLMRDFVTADKFAAPRFNAGGGTAIDEGIHLALDKIEQRKRTYNEYGIDYYRPWLFLITDGDLPEITPQVQEASRRLMYAHENKNVAAFSVGVKGANMEQLRLISPTKPMELEGLEFRSMFAWLSNSMSRVSVSRTGENVELDIDNMKYWVAS